MVTTREKSVDMHSCLTHINYWGLGYKTLLVGLFPKPPINGNQHLPNKLQVDIKYKIILTIIFVINAFTRHESCESFSFALSASGVPPGSCVGVRTGTVDRQT